MIENTNVTTTTNTINPLTEYTTYLTSLNKADNTIKSYAHDISLFFEYFNINTSTITNITTPPMFTLTRDQIITYKGYLQNVKNNNAKSINRSLSSLKSYNEFLVLKGWQESLVVLSQDYVKIQKQLLSPTNVSTKEAIHFMEKVKKNEVVRNYHIVALLLNTGLRISEILGVKLIDIHLDKKKLVIIGKGSKQRIIPLNPEAINIIEKSIEDRKNYRYAVEVMNSPYLFLSNKGGKLQSCTIERIFNKYSNIITCHSLRHVFATNFLENKGDIRELQQILGHEVLSTTAIYTHPSESSLAKSMNNCCIR